MEIAAVVLVVLEVLPLWTFAVVAVLLLRPLSRLLVLLVRGGLDQLPGERRLRSASGGVRAPTSEPQPGRPPPSGCVARIRGRPDGAGDYSKQQRG